MVSTACDLPIDSSSLEGPVVLGSSPADGAENVERLADFVVRFDRRLQPNSVIRGAVRVESGPQRLFLSMRVDPLGERLIAREWAGRALEANTLYRLEVEGVRDLDGFELAQPYQGTFRTGDALGEPGQERLASWAEVEPILASCATAGCHGAEEPAEGLDLSSAAAVARTAVGVPARQVMAGGARGSSQPLRGLTGMPLVDVLAGGGRPANSYLLYKMLDDPHILGDPMPPAAALDPSAAPSAEELAVISAWILAGAPTE